MLTVASWKVSIDIKNCTSISLYCTGFAEPCYSHLYTPIAFYQNILVIRRHYNMVECSIQNVRADSFDETFRLNVLWQKLCCILAIKEKNSTSCSFPSTLRTLDYTVPVMFNTATVLVSHVISQAFRPLRKLAAYVSRSVAKVSFLYCSSIPC